MKERFLSCLARYGDTLTWEGETLRAFLSPLRKTAEHGYGTLPTAIGTACAEEYLYFGDPDLGIAEGDWLEYHGRSLRVTQSKLVGVQDEAIYRWATLKVVAAC